MRSAVRLSLVLLPVAAVLSAAAKPVSAGVILTWRTTTAVVPGGTLSIDVTQPRVNIATSTTIDTCPATGTNTDIVVYSCDPNGPGIPAGTTMAQTWADPNRKSLRGPFTETVTYNANGPLSGTQSGPTQCDKTDTELYTSGWSCRLSALPTYPGQSLTIYVLASDGSLLVNGIGGLNDIPYPVEHIDYDDRLGSCLMDFTDSTPTFAQMVRETHAGSSTGASSPITADGYPGEVVGGTQWGSEIKAIFNCQAGEQIPTSAGLHFDAGSSATTTQAAAGTSGTTPTTVDVAEFTSYATPQPSPTTETVFGSS